MSVRPILGFAVVVLGLSGSIHAQRNGSLVCPATYANREAPGTAFWAVSPFAARRQLLVGQRHLIPALLQPVRELWLRRNTGDNRPLVAGQVSLQLMLSHSQRSADNPSTVFAANRGQGQTTVFSGTISLPASRGSPTVPAPWGQPHAFPIVFQQQFIYSGGTLCIEAVTAPIGQPPAWWPIDAVVERSPGAAALFGVGCIAAAPGVDTGSLVLGSTAVWFLRGELAAGSAGVCFLGTSKSRSGPFVLPLDLATAGAPGCWLNVDPVFGAPAQAHVLPESQRGLANWRGVLPLAAALAGRTVYNQWAWGEPGANPLGLTLSEGLAVTLSGIPKLRELSWVESVDLTSPAGELLRDRVPVFLLRW